MHKLMCRFVATTKGVMTLACFIFLENGNVDNHVSEDE